MALRHPPRLTLRHHRSPPLLRSLPVFSGNPAVVQHILKTNFPNYEKGDISRRALTDFLGHGIFNVDGESWKFQRQVSSHEFSTKSLRKFVETVVDTELSDRLIPILSSAAKHGMELSLIFKTFFKEKRLRIAVSEIREFAMNIINEKKQELGEKQSLDSVDLLSRFLSSGHSDENFVIDIVISFILAGRDTTSAALTWLFWLLSKNPEIESEILKEIYEKSEAPVYDEVKDMVYTHASLCESMRLSVPVVSDDVLPDGIVVKKGMRVSYFSYAMGRLEMLWGSEWAEFKPERWLQKEEENSNSKSSSSWKFVGRDSYTYPVFQAGPRICLGKEMAFL
ncbi:cytochrome p450 94a1 [Quercus suber]|uniref:Cytochrome p450 94a1 n=1 Tax=Quercus suber TaxID=58331 RepID=A0AAW0JCV9_QUESU